MKNFKSKLPDAKGFQWVTGVHLEDELREVLGVDTSRLGNIMSRDEIITLINEALIKAKKNADHRI